MNIQDVYNDKKEVINTKLICNFLEGELSMSVFIWIVNENGQLLIQQRSLKDDNKPGSWSITGGAVDSGETSLDAAVRESFEELGIKICKDNIVYIGTERRQRKFFEYYFISLNEKDIIFNIDKLEVEEIKWITLEEYENNISNAINFQMFKNFYKNIYLKKN